MNLRAAVVVSGMWSVTACGAHTDEYPDQERRLPPQGETALAEESEAGETPASLCERGCTWLDACCSETNRCLPSNCRSNCVTTLESSPSSSCLELADAIIDCLTATSCNQLDMGLEPLCATENQEFTAQGCGQAREHGGTLVLGVVGEDVPAAANAATAN